MSSITFDVPLINKLELYFIDTSRFNVIMRDCLRDNGVYFGDYYWFMSGYTPISSHNKISSAKINCVQTEICPSGERYDIDVGETVRFNNGFDVRVNSVIPGYPDAYANITVTEVDIVPNININSILLSETSVTIGDEVVFEVCMTNNGDRGDIELYTGFAYQDFIGGPALFLNGYIKQTIGDVLSGEYLCPYGEISVTQEVIDAKKSGKDVKFWALAVPGNILSKSVNIEIPQEPIFCTQYFRVEDQTRNPLKGVITSPTWNSDLQVLNTGEVSLYMEQGITHTVTVYNYEHDLQQTRTFTTCTSQPLIFVLDISDPCEGVVCDNICTDEGHLVIRECNPDLGICESVRTELNSPECVQPGNYIENITYEIESSIGYDEIIFNITIKNIDILARYFYVKLYDESGEFIDKEPDYIKPYVGPGQTYDIKLSSKLKTWNISHVEGQTVIIKLLSKDSLLSSYEVVDTRNVEVEAYIEPVKCDEHKTKSTCENANCYWWSDDTCHDTEEPVIGKIGTVTYDIIKQILNDEIVFYIPVTNLSDKERCFYVDLYDESGEFVDKAPNTLTPIGKFANKIAAGDTEIIEMNSNWELWHIGDVQGQVVTFKLKSDEVVPLIGYCSELHTTYDVVDEVTLDLNNIDIAINTRVDNIEGLITKSMEVGLLYVDPTTLTKTDVCNSPINITGDLNTEIVTGWFYPAPFTCSDKVYPADSMFVAYVKGSDDEDNEYYEISSIFRSVYGIKEVTLKVTSDSVVDDDGCYIWSPVDPTKCLITDNQAKFLMYGGIFALSLYGLHVFKPVIHGAGETLKELKK